MESAFCIETADTGSICNRVKPTLKKLVSTASLLDVQHLKGQCGASLVCGRQVAARLENQMVLLLFLGLCNLVNRVVIERKCDTVLS